MLPVFNAEQIPKTLIPIYKPNIDPKVCIVLQQANVQALKK